MSKDHIKVLCFNCRQPVILTETEINLKYCSCCGYKFAGDVVELVEFVSLEELQEREYNEA